MFVLWLPLLLVLGGLAWIYQFLIDWIPFIYLNFLLTGISQLDFGQRAPLATVQLGNPG